AHVRDVHLEEEHYFDDAAQCLDWFVADAIRSNVDLFVINGDLTTYKQTIQERNLWIETLIQMGNQAPVILVAGNHGKELDGDLHVFVRAKASHGIYLCTEREFIVSVGGEVYRAQSHSSSATARTAGLVCRIARAL